jgi:hypothetical protein
MAKISKDKGVILVLLERFKKYRLPRAMALREKVDRGELLNKRDHDLLKRVQDDRRMIGKYIMRNAEYQDLVKEVVELWEYIIAKDRENQENAPKKPGG